MRTLIEGVGRRTLNQLGYVGGFTIQLWAGLRAIGTSLPILGNRYRWKASVNQMLQIGVSALPMIALMAVCSGFILALQGASELRRFGALHYVIDLVAVGFTRELGPLLTAIAVSGRSGSAFAAEIGSMRVTEEIDALRVMAFEPIEFVLAPKYLAALIVVPCLSIASNVCGILAGGLFMFFSTRLAPALYLQYVLSSIQLRSGSIHYGSGGQVHVPGYCCRCSLHCHLLLFGNALMAIISVRDLVVEYDGRRVLDGLNVDIEQGETMVLLGGSGSGKSTLLRQLLGLEHPHSGSISVKGIDITRCSQADLKVVRRSLGVAFQSAALFNSFSVEDNVALALREHTALAPSIIDLVVWMKLALDEPSAGLDPIVAAELDELILLLKRAFQMTVIVVTHDLPSAFRIADRIAMLHKGTFLAVGTKDEIRSSENARIRQFLDRVPGKLTEASAVAASFERYLQGEEVAR